MLSNPYRKSFDNLKIFTLAVFLQPMFLRTALVCFLKQVHLDTVDHIIDMYNKLMLKVYNRADMQLDDAVRKQRRHLKKGQIMLNTITEIILDNEIKDVKLRKTIFDKISRETLEQHHLDSQIWLTGKLSHTFHLVVERFSYLRQFSPALISHLKFEARSERAIHVLKAIDLLQELNRQQKRKLPDNAPVDFIPKKLKPLIKSRGVINKSAWECALLTSIRDEIKIGNLTIIDSKRFGNFDNFFMPHAQWETERTAFLKERDYLKIPRKPDYI